MLLVGGHAEDISWYRARLFETVATLMIIFVLLYDVFRLYRDSHLKYQQSYQIRFAIRLRACITAAIFMNR
jgi:hypothetical protein